MASMLDLPGSAPSASPNASEARAALLRVLNVRAVAAVFYCCLLLVAGRMTMALYYDGLHEWLYAVLRYQRQMLVSGCLMLLGIGLAEAFVAARRWTGARALAVGIAACTVAALASLPARLFIAEVPIAKQLASELGWVVSMGALWAALGSLAFWLFHATRHDAAAQAALAESICRRDGLQAQMVEARLSALQAQIEPHFLFNTLANVKRLYETTPSRGREMLSSLIGYLRAALPSMRQSGSTVEREFDLARSYLTILRMRMGDRLRFDIAVQQGLEQLRMPPMVLATLVENAVKHGLSPLPEGGRIALSACRADDDLLVEVRDNGAGFSATGGSGVGLANTRSRLAALYGHAASLTLAVSSPRGVVAQVRLPAKPSASGA